MSTQIHPLLPAVFLFLGTSCSSEYGEAPEFEQSQYEVVISPVDLHGVLVLSAPTDSTQKTLSRTGTVYPHDYGTSIELDGKSFLAHLKGTRFVQRLEMGKSATLPEGDYELFSRFQMVHVTVVQGKTLTVPLKRIEVGRVSGFYSIALADDEPFVRRVPAGVGVDVFPGTYLVKVAYQEHVKEFALDLTAEAPTYPVAETNAEVEPGLSDSQPQTTCATDTNQSTTHSTGRRTTSGHGGHHVGAVDWNTTLNRRVSKQLKRSEGKKPTSITSRLSYHSGADSNGDYHTVRQHKRGNKTVERHTVAVTIDGRGASGNGSTYAEALAQARKRLGH